jgi:hypothetical protein
MKIKQFIHKSRKNEKAEKSGTAEKGRKKGRKAEIFRKKRKRWQPCLYPKLFINKKKESRNK